MNKTSAPPRTVRKKIAGKWNAGQEELLGQMLDFRRDTRVTPFERRPNCPRSEGEAYDLQDTLAGRLGQKVVGWKVGAYHDTSVQRALGLSQAFYGRVFAQSFKKSPAALKATEYPACHIEAELAIEIQREIAVHEPDISATELAGRISAFLPVFELVTSTWDDRNLLNGFDHVADNGGCGGLVVGKPISGWRDIDLQNQQAELIVSGKSVLKRQIMIGWHDMLESAAWLVNRLKSRGIAISAGQVIATGTLTGLTPVSPGDVVEARFGNFGKVRISLLSN